VSDRTDLLSRLETDAALSPTQREALRQAGFLRNEFESDHVNDFGRGSDWAHLDDEGWEAPPEPDGFEEPAEPVRRRKGRKGRRRRRTPAGALARRVARDLRSDLPSLRALLPRLIGPTGPATSWSDAMWSLHAADEEQLAALLAARLAERTVSLTELWPVFAANAHQSVLTDRTFEGPALTAYRSCLSAADQAVSATKYAWVLSRKPLARAVVFRAQQRRLLRALGQAERFRPGVLSLALLRSPSESAFRTLLLVYNSRCTPRSDPTVPPQTPPGWDARPLPLPFRLQPEEWADAWELALRIDPEHMLALFLACHSATVPPLWYPADWSNLVLRFAP
jgi:hypothetical protein